MAIDTATDNVVNNEDVLQRLKAMGIPIPGLDRPVGFNNPPAPQQNAPAAPVAVNTTGARPVAVNAPAATTAPLPFTPEYYQQKQLAEDRAKQQQPASILGRIGRDVSNVLRPIGEHLTESRAEREANQTRNLAGFEAASKAKLEGAQAKKAEEPTAKYSFHFQDDKGNVFGVRPDGTVDTITGREPEAKGKVTPDKSTATSTPFKLWHEQNPQGTYNDWLTATAGGKMDPAIIAQTGERPSQAVGETPEAYKARLNTWGTAYEDKKEEIAKQTALARGMGFGTFRPVQVVDKDGTVKWMFAGEAVKQGLGGAAEVAKIASKQAQFNDIKSASTHMRDAIKDVKDWGALQAALSTLAEGVRIGDAPALGNAISAIAKQHLSPESRELVQWALQLNERAMSLRNIAGMGGASDTLRNAITTTLPGIASGDSSYAMGQLDKFDNMVSNLEKGILKAKGAPGTETGGGKKWNAAKGIYE